MTRADAIARVDAAFTSGDFLAILDRMVGYRTESQSTAHAADLHAYLVDELTPALASLGFTTTIVPSPTGRGPYLLADYREDAALPTVLIYGHGDVVPGMEGEWRDGRDPWRCTTVGERVYGRGTADNKGQHAINIAALRAVHDARGGRLGFNAKFIVEMGEEIGSPDLAEVCRTHRDALKADLFLASDGPRLSAERPTIFLGCRGGRRIHLDIELRDGAHHSGNWGGLLANPATILASAIATLVDAQGRILLEALKPPRISNQIRAALANVVVAPTADEPAISDNWGEDDLTPAERLYAWNTLEVLAINAGNVANPANAIPGKASAVLQLRFVVGTDIENVVPAIAAHFAANGFGAIKVSQAQYFSASRTDIDNPWVGWAVESVRRTTGRAPALLPNFGGSLPNDVFADILGLPTIWVPHSYPGCSQHAPDEHILLPVTQEALGIMAGLFWDLGENPVRA
jgi:acetylornithine deacetylase/succinyl-diaminopimelate desuccinylase-like protein